jgi:hypothetical protein
MDSHSKDRMSRGLSQTTAMQGTIATRQMRSPCQFAAMTQPSAVVQTAETPRGTLMWRVVPLAEADRDFDLHFWQSQPPSVRFAAAWELVENAWAIKGRPAHELRLQRTAHHFERL